MKSQPISGPENVHPHPFSCPETKTLIAKSHLDLDTLEQMQPT